jgi:protocatechuate 3,4-dioxygenase beta subunit
MTHPAIHLLVLAGAFAPAPKVPRTQHASPPRPAAAEAAEPLYRAARARASEEPEAVLEALGRALEAGASAARVLTERGFEPLHGEPGFRRLIRAHAPVAEITIVGPDEPGDPLEVSGTVRDADGAPVGDALVYVFQTDASGHYTRDGMNERRARLFGYVRTDAEGRYAFRTIRPGRDPGEDEGVDQHIHFEITAPSRRATQSARLGFADDPVWRRTERAAPAWAVPVVRGEDGVQRCVYDVVLR